MAKTCENMPKRKKSVLFYVLSLYMLILTYVIACVVFILVVVYVLMLSVFQII
jgi:hypothetical protein